MSSPTNMRERFEEKFGGTKTYHYFARQPDEILAFIQSELSAQEVRVREAAEAEFGAKLDKHVSVLLAENRDELQRQKEIARKRATKEAMFTLRPKVNRLLLIKGAGGKDLVVRDDVLALLSPQPGDSKTLQ